jgi:hypothetical protein
MNKKIIEFYIREVYGNKLGYIKNPADAMLVQQLTGKKTIDPRTRELFRDLSGGMIQFQQVMFE